MFWDLVVGLVFVFLFVIFIINVPVISYQQNLILGVYVDVGTLT
jgi:hypothetical protein